MNRPIDPNMILNETCVIRFISAAESIQEHELLLWLEIVFQCSGICYDLISDDGCEQLVFKLKIPSCWIWKYSSFTCFLRNQLSQHPRRFCWPPPCLELASHFEFLTSRIGWYFPTSQYFNIRKSRPQILPAKFSDFWNWGQRLNFPIIGKIFGNPAHSISSGRSLFWKWAPISWTNTREIVNGNHWKLRKWRTDFLFKYEVECQNGDEIWRRTNKKRCLSEHQNINIVDIKNLNEPKDAH